MSCGSLGGRGGLGRMGTCECMAESLCCPFETITTLLIGYAPIQNKKFKKKINKTRRKKGIFLGMKPTIFTILNKKPKRYLEIL